MLVTAAVPTKGSINDQVRPTLLQIDPSHLRPRTGAVSRTGTAKGKVIEKGNRNVMQSSINSNQPQTKAKGSRCLGRRTWLTDLLEQLAQGLHTQLLPPIGESTGSRQADVRIRPDIAQSLRHFLQDMGDRQTGKQSHGNDHPNDRHHLEVTFALFPGVTGTEHFTDQRNRKDLIKDIHMQIMTKFALGRNLT